MTALAVLLEFKFPGVAGIRTRENARGEMEIFDWPLGVTPNATQIAAWQVEYDTRTVARPDPDFDAAIQASETLQQLKDVLVGKIELRRKRNE